MLELWTALSGLVCCDMAGTTLHVGLIGTVTARTATAAATDATTATAGATAACYRYRYGYG